MKTPTTLWMLCLVISSIGAQDVDSLERELALPHPPAERLALLNELAFRYQEFDPEKTRAYGEEALTLATELGKEKEAGRACNVLAGYYLNVGEIEKTSQYFAKALSYFEQAGEDRGCADVLGNLGYLYYQQGKYDQALEYSFMALRRFEALDFLQGQANSLSAAGSIYMEQGLFDKAIHYDTLALRLYQKIPDREGEAMVLGNLANIYADQGHAALAAENYQAAIDIYSETGNPSGLGRNLSNLGILYNDLGKYAEAHEALTWARDIFTAKQFASGICYTIGNLGASYYLSYRNYGRTDSTFQCIPGSRPQLLRIAIDYLKEGVSLAEQTGDLNALQTFAEILANALQDAGNPAEALRFFKMYQAAKDSVFNLDRQTAIQQLTTEREVELKNKQIELDRLAVQKKRNERVYFIIGLALLAITIGFVYRNYINQKKSNKQLSETLHALKSTQEQLVESEKQKENALIRSRISQDIHDDISSGLTKISWLAEALKAQKNNDQLADKIMLHARENVTKLSEIIWSSNPDQDNLHSLLGYIRRYVANYMEDAPMRWKVEIDETVPDAPIHPELRRNLFLAMKEALHNARKYSQASEITVSFALDHDKCLLEVRDDGIGMDPDHIQGDGNGLRNMRRRMEAVNGVAEFVSAPGGGTIARFEAQISTFM